MWSVYPINPVAKPRMTRTDRWKGRASVLRFFAFRDEVRKLIPAPKGPFGVVFLLPMPDYWSLVKMADHENTIHTMKPDLDNLIKGLFDSLYTDDSHAWCVSAAKIWSRSGSIIILPIEDFVDYVNGGKPKLSDLPVIIR